VPIDYSNLALPKHAPARSKAYLDYVREQICAVNRTASFTQCGGRTEAAHLEVAGRSIKASDFLTVPLCTRHHAEQHSIGILTFQANHGIGLWETAAHLLARWCEGQ